MNPRTRVILALYLLIAPGALAQAPPPDSRETVDEIEIYHEDFDSAARDLFSLGWTTATLDGPRPPFRHEPEGGRLLRLENATGVATAADADGRYPSRLDARLVSPVLDLRSIARAAPPPMPRPNAPFAADVLEAAAPASAAASENASNDSLPLRVGGDLRDPSTLQAEADSRPATQTAAEPLLWPPGSGATGNRTRLDDRSPYPNLSYLSPVGASAGLPAPEEAAPTVRLVVRHAWAFAPGDGVLVEARTRGADGWSEWSVLDPSLDAVGGHAQASGIVPASRQALYNGRLPSGEPAYLGESPGVVTSQFPLGALAGSLVQVAFRVKADAPLPPDGFGWALDAFTLRAALGEPDVAIEDLGGVAHGTSIPLGERYAPTLHVRNWGVAPTPELRVTARLLVDGEPATGSPASWTLRLGPGERKTLTLPALRLEAPANLTLAAEIVRDPARPDADISNDRLSASFRAADTADVRLTLVQAPANVVSASGDEKAFAVEAVNVGNAPAVGTLALLATPLDSESMRPLSPPVVVAETPFQAPAGVVGMATGLAPESEPVRAELRWTPSQRGAYRLEAALGSLRSDGVYTYVDLSPPPILLEPFPAAADATRPYGPSAADSLANWSFEGWSLDGDVVVRDSPAFPSPSRALVARAVDGVGGSELSSLQQAARRADRTGGLHLALPGVDRAEQNTSAGQAAEVDLSYATLLFATRDVRCAGAGACEDPAARVPLLRELLDASVGMRTLDASKNSTEVAYEGASFRLGGENASLLYTLVDGRVDPGVSAWHAPLEVRRGNGDGAALLPQGRLQPYEDGGLRCCVVGPFSLAEILEALPAESLPRPPQAGTTQVFERHQIGRGLDDLLEKATPEAEVAVAFEHLAAFAWSNGSGTRGILEIEAQGALPPDARAGPVPPSTRAFTLERPTQGWAPIVVPLTDAERAGHPRIRLTLERVGPAGEIPLACPHLDPEAACTQAPAWVIDDVRILERANPRAPWRVVAQDDLEREDQARMWSGESGLGAPSASSRGWSLERAARAVPHRFSLADAGVSRDGEPNATRALRWGEPSTLRTATTAAAWSVARSPALDLTGAVAPRLTLSMRYDFGPEHNGTYGAGGALVALAERADGSLHRALLVPSASDAAGGAYRGDVAAPAFDALARALRIEVPRSATATAFVGASGEGKEPAWTRVEVDLAPLGKPKRVWLEFHAVSSSPLRALGWVLDDVRVGEAGPAHDLALTGFPTLPAPAAVGAGVPLAIAVNLSAQGRFPPTSASVEAWIEDANRTPVYPAPREGASWAPARLDVPVHALQDAGAGPLVIAFPEAWTPAAYGRHRLVARVVSEPADESPANDLVEREVTVRDEVAASLRTHADGQPLRVEGASAPGEPLGFVALVENTGTLPLGVARPASVRLQVFDGEAPLLEAPAEADLGMALGRPLGPGEMAEVRLARAWTPPRSGTYRVEVSLGVPDLADRPIVTLPQALRVEEPLAGLDLAAFRPTGSGWTNASAGRDPAAWTFVASEGAHGTLEPSAPLNLRGAVGATLALTHRHRLEDSFDAGSLEVLAPDGRWLPVAPETGWPGEVVVPQAAAGEALAVGAFTGRSEERTDLFDLTALPELRERYSPLNTTRVGMPPASELWLGPSDASAWRAASRAAPLGAPEDAIAYERRDRLAFDLEVPPGGAGTLVASLRDWRALGYHGAQGVDASAVAIYLEGPSGRRFDATARDAPEDHYRDWTTRRFAFPGALDALAGQKAALVVEHKEIAARVPVRYDTGREDSPSFASDLISPHGGYAVRRPGLAVESGGARQEVDLAETPTVASHARWLLPAAAIPAQVPDGAGFAPLERESLWAAEGTGWNASAASSTFPDARLVFPLDLRLAAHNATLAVLHETRLTRLRDHETGSEGALSGVAVEVSVDGGRNWNALPSTDSPTPFFLVDGSASTARHSSLAGAAGDPEGNSAFGVGGEARSGDSDAPAWTVYDISGYAGRDVLVAMHASLSTTRAAREDFWRVHALRADVDVFRGDDVRIRLRGSSDSDGNEGAWELVSLEGRIVRHGRGLGVRLVAPDDGPLTQGFRTLGVELVNRGLDTTAPTTLRVLVQDPAERGGRAHGANRTVGPVPAGQSVLVPIRGADLNWFLAAGASPSVVELEVLPLDGEAFLGDNHLRTEVGGANVQARSSLEPLRMNISSQAVDLGDPRRPPIAFTTLVANDGEDIVTLGPSTLRVWKDGANVRNLTNARPTSARVLPGETVELAWTWRPSADAEPGSYTARADIATSVSRGAIIRSLNETFLLGGPFLEGMARVERFGPSAEGWTCVTPAPCAREETAVHRSAPASLAVGVAPSGVASPTAERVVLQSPEFPVNASLGGILRFHARHAFAPGAGAAVLAAPVFENGTTGDWTQTGRLEGGSSGYDEGRFAETALDVDHVASREGVRGVVLRFDAPAPPQGGSSLILDDVSVTPLAAGLAAPGRIVVADGVEKRIPLVVRNEGALADEYALSFRDALGRSAALPEGWQARIVDPLTGRLFAASNATVAAKVAVPARGERLLHLVVASAPTGTGAPLRGPTPIPIALNSTLLPDLSRALTLDVRAQGMPRPDVAVIALEARGASEPAGRARTVEVAVANRGLASVAATVSVLVHPPPGVAEAPERLASLDGSTHARPALGAGAAKTLPFVWTPRHAGPHRIVATIDPGAGSRESDVGNNRLERVVDVGAIPFPDLKLQLELDTQSPIIGVPVGYTLKILNRGAGDAREVEATLRAGVVDALAGESPRAIGDIPPGGERALQGVWTPEIAGGTRLIASAFSRSGLPERVETLADNAIVLAVTVREPSARLERASGPGETGFRLTNGGNANETYRLEASLPEGWSYSILSNGTPARRVTLAPGESVALALRVLPARDALAGSHPVRLVAVSEETGLRQRAEAQHEVPRRPSLRVSLLPEAISPASPALVVRLDNEGNLEERVRFDSIRLPPSWRLTGTTATLGPRSSATVRLALDLGNRGEPGAVPVALAWNGSVQSGQANATLQVEAVRRVEMTLEGEALAGGRGALRAVLSNRGNVPAGGLVRLELPPGYASDLHLRSVLLPPGSSTTLLGYLAAPADPADEVRLVAALEGDSSPSATATLPVARADLALESWEAPRESVAGETGRHRFVVLNHGSAELKGVYVELRVDGSTAAVLEMGDLPPGAEADGALSWRAAPGVHTLTLAAAATGSLAERVLENNAQARTIDVPAEPERGLAAARLATPLPPALAVAALLLGLLRRRSI